MRERKESNTTKGRKERTEKLSLLKRIIRRPT